MKGKQKTFDVGKLPQEFLKGLLTNIPINDPNVLVGPGIGEDAAVVRFNDTTLIFKTDPITFAARDISRYLVTVNANDIACMGGIPRYMLVTYLLPENRTNAAMVKDMFAGLNRACAAEGITLIGGHTEITYGIDRPLAIGFLIGELWTDQVIRTSDASPGDTIMASKAIPLEAMSILAHDIPQRLGLDDGTLKGLCNLLYDPGIGVGKEARIALNTGGVTCMHDPTEGGLATGLQEIAAASGVGLEIYMDKVPILDHAKKVLEGLGINPLGAIASGSLVVCCKEGSAKAILRAWAKEKIQGSIIGKITGSKDMILYQGNRETPLPVFKFDEISKLFSSPER
ncbi:MAG: AIR synthase-related protein [Thermodesulfobacteriota bacterium]|nr:AIR synthase-related protein [Thermodesulfobacteriota bacterium]